MGQFPRCDTEFMCQSAERDFPTLEALVLILQKRFEAQRDQFHHRLTRLYLLIATPVANELADWLFERNRDRLCVWSRQWLFLLRLLRWMPATCDPHLACVNDIIVVHLKRNNRRSSDWGQTDDH